MNETLEHHGILGMKWGVRRYQNKDGTWTKEGKEHRAEGSSQASPEPTTDEGSGASSKTADQTVQDISKKLLTEREMMDTDSQRSINAAKTGLSCIKAARPWDGDDFDPESKVDQEWFLIEDQTFGLPQIADLANQGYDEKEINKMLSDGLEAYEKSKYANGFSGDKGTDVSGLWYLTMSGYGDGWNSSNISDYIRECANYAKDETKHSDNSSEDILEHHGILGMKWGIRRYQNSDGSLTAAGRKRYGVDENDGQRSSSGPSSGDSSNSITRTPAKSASEMTDQELNQALNRLRMEQQYNELTGAKSSNQYQNQQNFSTPPSNTGNLSNAELQAYITRLDMEKRYAQLTAPPPKQLTNGQKFLKEVIPAVAMEVGRELVKSTMKKMLGLSGDNNENKNNNNNDNNKKKDKSENNNDALNKLRGRLDESDKRMNLIKNSIESLDKNMKTLSNKSNEDRKQTESIQKDFLDFMKKNAQQIQQEEKKNNDTLRAEWKSNAGSQKSNWSYSSGSDDYSYYENPWTYRVNRV